MGEVLHLHKLLCMKTILLSLLLIGFGISNSQAQLQDVLNKVGAKVNAGSLLSQFAGALKPGSMLTSWASGGKSKWLSAASKVTDAIGMAKSISSLTGFIKPGMFKQGFDVSSLLQTANTVKTVTDATGLLKNLEGGVKPEAFTSTWAGKRKGWLSALDMLK